MYFFWFYKKNKIIQIYVNICIEKYYIVGRTKNRPLFEFDQRCCEFYVNEIILELFEVNSFK